MTDYLILAVAAFFAGILNTIAGGGTFLTFPALVFVGVPPVVANATSAVAVFPGYLGGLLGFRKEVQSFDRKQLIRIAIVTVLGGLVGSLLLLVSSDEAFSLVIPFLLLLATGIFAFGDKIRQFAQGYKGGIKPYGFFGMFLVAIYGGYFNGGLGIVLLALFALWGMTNLNQMNGLKSGLSFVLSAISVITFAIAGIVVWPQAVVMMLAATAGGYLGAPIARALPKSAVKVIIIVIGLTMSVVFLYRLF